MSRCVVVVLMLAAACSRDGRGGQGTERGACRAGSACDPGLLCLSNVCVRPPPADCAAVGEAVASFDLGNYAEPEDRAPIVAKYKAACEKAHVTQDQGACLDKAKDKWSASQCAPAMFPELASTNTGDCTAVIVKVEAALHATMQANNPQLAQWQQTIMRVMKESCAEDAWPDALKKCILISEIKPGADAMQACNQQMPPALQNKLQQRLSTAMAAQQQQQ